MSGPPDKDAREKPLSADDRPGRVEFDSRGNSVWRWARDVLDSTSILLKRLDNKDLALEPTQKVPVMGSESKQGAGSGAKPTGASSLGRRQGAAPTKSRKLEVEGSPRDSGGGFDPYNRR